MTCHELCGVVFNQGGRVGDFKTLTDMVRLARNNLDKGDWDYLVGAADTEASLNRNRAAVDSWTFLPRILQDVSDVKTSTQLLGQTLRIPVVLPPIGSVQAFTEKGGSAVAEAAADFGVLQILSSSCSPDFEAVAQQIQGPRIYQLYLSGDQAWLDDQIARTISSGYIGFCLTADTQVYSRRERDIMKNYVPMQARMATGTMLDQSGVNYQSTMSWDTVAHIKEKFDIPLIVKGVMNPEDAKRCVEVGVDVVYVSNHGGRQLDHTVACIDALPAVVEAVDGRVPVVVDGGFMRGADVIKGLCLGATAVGMGRFEALAAAAGGAAAIGRALSI
ncbi:MAG TPA: alpha-hydroxy-acid oxidizing enzyme, partial [Gammaproteobacteria bacterium]|nr:alpha-hydroxy-acid oxidizing enzyme [Gammaproteobacteria bacterium]